MATTCTLCLTYPRGAPSACIRLVALDAFGIAVGFLAVVVSERLSFPTRRRVRCGGSLGFAVGEHWCS